MQTYQFRWDVIPNNLDFLMSGFQMTLIISATALVFAMIGGLLLALVDMSRYLAVRAIGLAIGEVIRNTPICCSSRVTTCCRSVQHPQSRLAGS
jgi:ABC-type amino acid transport system permease subunit